MKNAMGRLTGFVICGAIALSLAGCPKDTGDPVDPGPPPAKRETIDPKNVAALCDLISSGGNSGIGQKAEMSGIPDGLRKKAKAYAANLSEDNKKLALWACADAGYGK